MYKGHTEAGGVQPLPMDARPFRNGRGTLITPLPGALQQWAGEAEAG